MVENNLDFDYRRPIAHTQYKHGDKKEKKPPKAIITIPMHQLQHTNGGLVMIMARVALAGGQYFPVPSGVTPRYNSAIIPTLRTDYRFGVYHSDGINDRVIVDTKQKLLAKKEWK